MKFVEKHMPPPTAKNYKHDEIEIARTFSKKIWQEAGGIVKEVILFGETARSPEKAHDVDILVLVDDVSIQLTPEITQTYRVLVEKIILATSPRLHVMTLKITTFWEYVRAGDPVIINVLRDGVALIDTGFFDPLQMLLRQGRIRPTPESIWNYLNKAPQTMNNATWHLLQATLDLYWAVIDTAHAALMAEGIAPTAPQHVATLMHEHMVKTKKIHQRYSDTMNMFYNLSKKIVHREMTHISGTEYEKYRQIAKDFVETISKHAEETMRRKK